MKQRRRGAALRTPKVGRPARPFCAAKPGRKAREARVDAPPRPTHELAGTTPLVVVIAGRPNAGKSTLFNRLLRRRRAIVAETPGVTRDENRARLTRGGRLYELVDTGGIEETALERGLAERVQEKSLAALRSADVIVHLLDGRAGLSGADRAIADRIRAFGVPVVLAANKIDRADQESRALEFHALGADAVVAVSSAHGLGIEALWDQVALTLRRAGKLDGSDDTEAPPAGSPTEETSSDGAPSEEGDESDAAAVADAEGTPHVAPRVALVGRPNVGKSSLLNRLCGFDRSLVDATAGTTRDAIDVEVRRGDRSYLFVDTAGLRRPSRIVETIEGHAAAASLRSLDRAEVVVLVLDAELGISDQDLRIADLVWRKARGFVIAVNKVDLAPDLATQQCHDAIARRLPQWPPLPVVPVSAQTGKGIGNLVAVIDQVAGAYRRRIPTPKLNALLREAVEAHPPALVRGRAPRLLYAAQIRSAPQEIAIAAHRPESISVDYQRYLSHRIREAYGLVGVPLRLRLRTSNRSRPPAA